MDNNPVPNEPEQNTAVGTLSLHSLTHGQRNTALGCQCLEFITDGCFNTCIGNGSGYYYTGGSESSNILIGHGTFGTTGENNTLRIGRLTGTGDGYLNQAFISGIYGITPAGTGIKYVVIDSSNQLGTVSGATTGWVPTVMFGSGNTGITYSAQTGSYSRIGNIVYFTALVTLTNKGSSTGALIIDNLPVTPAVDTYCTGYLANVNYSGTYVVGVSNTTGHLAFIYTDNISGGGAYIDNTMCDNDLKIRVSGFYFV
jgi:hypothetical protein